MGWKGELWWQWGMRIIDWDAGAPMSFTHFGSSFSLTQYFLDARCLLPQRLESTCPCTNISRWAIDACEVLFPRWNTRRERLRFASYFTAIVTLWIQQWKTPSGTLVATFCWSFFSSYYLGGRITFEELNCTVETFLAAAWAIKRTGSSTPSLERLIGNSSIFLLGSFIVQFKVFIDSHCH